MGEGDRSRFVFSAPGHQWPPILVAISNGPSRGETGLPVCPPEKRARKLCLQRLAAHFLQSGLASNYRENGSFRRSWQHLRTDSAISTHGAFTGQSLLVAPQPFAETLRHRHHPSGDGHILRHQQGHSSFTWAIFWDRILDRVSVNTLTVEVRLRSRGGQFQVEKMAGRGPS